MAKDLSELQQAVEGWIEEGLKAKAEAVVVQILKLGTGQGTGAAVGILYNKPAPEVVGRAKSHAAEIVQRAFARAKDLKVRQAYAFIMPNGEERTFAVQPPDDDDDDDEPGLDDVVPNEKGVIRLLMHALEQERKHSRKSFKIATVAVKSAGDSTNSALGHLRDENNKLHEKHQGVLETSLAQTVERHRMEMQKLVEGSKTKRMDTMVEAAGAILQEVAPGIGPKIRAALGRPPDPNAPAGGAASIAGVPIEEAAKRIVGMIERQQIQINGIYQALTQAGIVQPKPGAPAQAQAPAPVEPTNGAGHAATSPAPTPEAPSAAAPASPAIPPGFDIGAVAQQIFGAIEQQQAQIGEIVGALRTAKLLPAPGGSGVEAVSKPAEVDPDGDEDSPGPAGTTRAAKPNPRARGRARH